MTATLPVTLPIIERHKSEALHVWAHRGTSDTLVVCFSGIGKLAEVSPPYEFARAATQNGQHNVLFISDPNRSWLNGPGLLEAMVEQVEAFRQSCGVKRVVSMGHSMGGFSALVLPSVTPVDEVLAFAPQVSIHPEIVPDETRWANYRDQVHSYRVKSVNDCLNTSTQYTVIHGRHGREAPQRDRFEAHPNLRRYVMPNTHHNVPQRLKDLGCLQEVVGFAIAGRPRKLRLRLQNEARARLLA